MAAPGTLAAIRRTAACGALAGGVAAGGVAAGLSSGCAFHGSHWGHASYHQADYELSISAEHPGEPPDLVKVENSNGSVRVVEHDDASTIVIDATVRLRTDDRAERFDILASVEAGNVLRVRPLWPDGRKLGNESCSFRIAAPRETALDVRTSNGSIVVEGGDEGAVLRSSNGAITVVDRAGSLVATTSNGKITVLRTRGELDLETSNGGIRVEDAHLGDGALRAVTSNGSINAEIGDALPGRVYARTTNGTARIYQRPEGGSTKTIARGRTLELAIGDASGEVDLRSSNGSVTLTTR
ncbi:MAG: hypothetical protein AAFX79_06055 [Planctomycetota bacterium]